MDLISVCVYLTIGILGVAYPVVLQVVSRLDETYNSIVIVELFSAEKELKRFRLSLYAAVVAIVIWGLQLPPLIDGQIADKILPQSGRTLAIIVTLILVVYFFLLVEKVFIYLTTVRIVRYLIKKHEPSAERGDYRYFQAINDVLYTSIRKLNTSIVKTISDYVYQAFKKERINQGNKPVEFPTEYYQLAYNVLLELHAKPDLRLRYLGSRAAGGIWIIGEFADSEISEMTYSWLWNIMRLVIEQEEDDFVMDLWEHADQHAGYQLDVVPPAYIPGSMEVANQEQISKRKKDRTAFEEFFIALGGLLLYRKRINCIRRMFKHTRSMPPSYELLPETMTDVFIWYNRFIDRGDRFFPWIASKYSFPDLSGTNNDGLIKSSIARYIALLFLRQYSIVPHLIYMQPLGLPIFPTTQGEKSNWLSNMDYFKELVLALYDDKELMSAVGLGFLNDQWCIDNHHPTPSALIDQIKTNLEQGIEQALREQAPAPDKISLFLEASNAILTPAMEQVQRIVSTMSIDTDPQKWFIQGENQVLDKSAFVHDQEADHLNYHTFLAEALADKIRRGISEVLWRCKTQQYLIHQEQIKEALTKLDLNNEDFVVLSFGIDLEYFAKAQGWNATNTRFLFFADSISQVAGYCFFIVREKDLPVILFKQPDAAILKEYGLVLLNKSYELYASVTDLNTHDTLRASLQPSAAKGRDLRKSVLQSIYFNIEWQFRKKMPCFYFQIVQPYRQQGVPHQIKDINKFG